MEPPPITITSAKNFSSAHTFAVLGGKSAPDASRRSGSANASSRSSSASRGKTGSAGSAGSVSGSAPVKPQETRITHFFKINAGTESRTKAQLRAQWIISLASLVALLVLDLALKDGVDTTPPSMPLRLRGNVMSGWIQWYPYATLYIAMAGLLCTSMAGVGGLRFLSVKARNRAMDHFLRDATTGNIPLSNPWHPLTDALLMGQVLVMAGVYDVEILSSAMFLVALGYFSDVYMSLSRYSNDAKLRARTPAEAPAPSDKDYNLRAPAKGEGDHLVLGVVCNDVITDLRYTSRVTHGHIFLAVLCRVLVCLMAGIALWDFLVSGRDHSAVNTGALFFYVVSYLVWVKLRMHAVLPLGITSWFFPNRAVVTYMLGAWMHVLGTCTFCILNMYWLNRGDGLQPLP